MGIPLNMCATCYNNIYLLHIFRNKMKEYNLHRDLFIFLNENDYPVKKIFLNCIISHFYDESNLKNTVWLLYLTCNDYVMSVYD